MTVALALVNQYFFFRKFPFVLSSVVVMVVTYPAGKLLELILPKHRFRLGSWRFFLNPGPFNLKEHALIMIFTNSAANWPYGILFVTSSRLEWGVDIGLGWAFLVVALTQLLGFGLGGHLRRIAVLPANMFWPTSLVSITILRAMHEAGNDMATRHASRFRVFGLVAIGSLLFYLLPGYLFQMLSAFPIMCLLAPNSTIAHQLGGPINGLGIGTFSFDWSAITSNLGSPLVTPFYVACNFIAGFVFFVWILAPVGYFVNLWGAQTLPIAGYGYYDSTGAAYNLTRVVDAVTHELDVAAFEEYGPPRITLVMAITYFAGMSALGAVIPYIALYHLRPLMRVFFSAEFQRPDIHTKMMARYKDIPSWWFTLLMLLSLSAGVVLTQAVPQVQLTCAGLLIAFSIGAVFAFPNAILYAVTSQFISIHIFAEMLCGLLFPGLTLGNMLFKTVALMTCYQALNMLYNLKLGHYLKLPPRTTFCATVAGTLVAAAISAVVACFVMDTIPDLCVEHPHHASSWSCENPEVFHKASVLWGLIGPLRMFGSATPYQPILYGFFLGFLLPFPVYFLAKRFPGSVLLNQLNIPILMGSVAMLPPAYPFQYPAWFLLAFLFNGVLYRYRFQLWSRYNYAISAGLDFGSAIAFFLIYFLVTAGLEIDWWGNQISDMCPLESSLP
ncbi:hypothetical protein DSO57_1007896 [Entomophthora muscae]|uniref:Uncharacterized protein n=1 Tax=Entomophthora muscae TaxID=34485 RepID=A0ACC2SKF4_9FUNG|nr:hypothetical protein DSO57_1007896 [Entomophthora muscae]